MNDFVIGVKPIANGVVAEVDEEVVGSVGAMWVTLDGRELPTDGSGGLIGVKVEADAGPLHIVLTLFGHTVKFIDFRDAELAPERFRVEGK
jgi:hypothetical protein